MGLNDMDSSGLHEGDPKDWFQSYTELFLPSMNKPHSMVILTMRTPNKGSLSAETPKSTGAPCLALSSTLEPELRRGLRFEV